MGRSSVGYQSAFPPSPLHSSSRCRDDDEKASPFSTGNAAVTWGASLVCGAVVYASPVSHHASGVPAPHGQETSVSPAADDRSRAA